MSELIGTVPLNSCIPAPTSSMMEHDLEIQAEINSFLKLLWLDCFTTAAEKQIRKVHHHSLLKGEF